MDQTVIVNYIPDAWDDKRLHAEFARFEPTNVKLVTERSTGRTLGYGFVSFTNAETARKAIHALNGQAVDGKRLKVTLAKPREEVRYNTNIYVSGLPPTATEEWLRSLCSYHGQILELKLLTDSAARGKHDTLSGFVRYARRNESDACINAVHRSRVKAPPAPNGEDVRTATGEPVEGREYLVSARYATDTRTRQKETEGIWISNSTGDGRRYRHHSNQSGRHHRSHSGNHDGSSTNSQGSPSSQGNSGLSMNFNFENGGDDNFGRNRPQNVRGKGGLLFPNTDSGNFQYNRSGMGGNHHGKGSRSHSHNRHNGGDKNLGGNRPFGDGSNSSNQGNNSQKRLFGEFEQQMDKNQPYYFVPNPALPGLGGMQSAHPFPPMDPSGVPIGTPHMNMAASMMNQNSFLSMYPPNVFPSPAPFGDQILFPGSLFTPYPYEGIGMSPNFPGFSNLDPNRILPNNEAPKDGESGDEIALLNSTMAAVALNDDKDVNAADAKSAGANTADNTASGETGASKAAAAASGGGSSKTGEKASGSAKATASKAKTDAGAAGETDGDAPAAVEPENNQTILPATDVKSMSDAAAQALNMPGSDTDNTAEGLGNLPFLTSMSLGPDGGVANPYYYPQVPGVAVPDMFGAYPTFSGYMVPAFPAQDSTSNANQSGDFSGNLSFGQDVDKETHARVGALGIPTSPRHPDLDASHVLGPRFNVPMQPATSLEGLDSLSLVPPEIPSAEEDPLLEKIRDSWNVN